jgi:hypothetical protein
MLSLGYPDITLKLPGLGVNYAHASLVGEFPEMLAPAADADLNGTRGIEHAVQYRLAEWTAMVESAPFIDTSSVAMRVDVHEAYWRQLRARSGT